MSVPLAITTAVGVIMMFSAALSTILFPRLPVIFAFILFGISIFVTMPSWEFFLGLGARYYVTNLRVLAVWRGGFTRELGFDNIEGIGREEGFNFGSWHISFTAADGSDIDSWIDNVPARWVMRFSYLWRRESAKAERLVKERLLPIKEPRVYRCMSCSFQGNTEQDLRDHINVEHHGSAS